MGSRGPERLGPVHLVNLGGYNTALVYNGCGEIQRMFNDRIRDVAYGFDRWKPRLQGGLPYGAKRSFLA